MSMRKYGFTSSLAGRDETYLYLCRACMTKELRLASPNKVDRLEVRCGPEGTGIRLQVTAQICVTRWRVLRGAKSP